MTVSALLEHGSYLRDERRNRAYRSALEAAVQPGARVLDLGCGTGLLGLLALRAGAAHVDAVESTGLIELARELAAANGLADAIDHHQVWSTNLELPEPVDVVVCDQADGVFGVECGLLDAFMDARDRLARRGAALVPMALTPLLVPIRSAKLREQLGQVGESSEDVDTSAMARRAESTIWYANLDSIESWGDEVVGTPLRFADQEPGPVRAGGAISAAPEGGWDGLACTYRVELAPGTTISTSPGSPDAIDRTVSVVPLPAGVDVARASVSYYPRSGVVRWDLERSSGTEVRSTLDGILQTALLRRLDGSRRPTPTAQGAEALALLEAAASGEHTIDELSKHVSERHRDLLDKLISDGYLT